MDGPPAQSLGLEGPEENIMRRPPEKGELINKKTLIKITISGIVMTIGTLGLFLYELNSSGTNVKTKAITVAFTVFMVLARLISGVHWITDIIGGALFSAGVVLVYYSISSASAKSN